MSLIASSIRTDTTVQDFVEYYPNLTEADIEAAFLYENKVQRLSRAIRNMNPDVLVLSEVNPDSVATDIKNQLSGYDVRILSQTASQNIAILFKNSVTVSNVQLIPGSDDGNQRLRRALAARVKVGQFDFILIGVHMKAGRPRNPQTNSRDPQRIRTRQATAIANFIRQQTQGSERDVLLVGDYNMVPGQDAVNFRTMSPGPSNNEFLRYISSQALSLSHINDCGDGGEDEVEGRLLDGFAISRVHTREFVAGSMRTINFNDASVFSSETGTPFTCTTYTGFISDHLPLVARFRTNQDDDD
ncbi:MAG: endonuclease/exonuclease/phosphatase family protein [Acidobacteriota bacterium]|nr:endonuclease/exonuclease/phosphatase family protein [Acidobacteriota bacterium]